MPDSMKLNPLEFAKTVGVHGINDTRFRIRIPRWMINTARDKERISFNSNIFINDSSCKVTPSSSVMTQNYITVPRTPNCDLEHVSVIDDNGDKIIPDNTSVICTCFYGRHIYLTDTYQE